MQLKNTNVNYSGFKIPLYYSYISTLLQQVANDISMNSNPYFRLHIKNKWI